MGLKKRNKTSAEFSMSSLTDIIFLLLIFFMLTSNLVAPNALNLKLPGSSSSAATSSDALTDVAVKRNGTFYLDGRKISQGNLEKALRKIKSSKKGKLDMTISPDNSAPNEQVVAVLDMAMRLQINAILATDVD